MIACLNSEFSNKIIYGTLSAGMERAERRAATDRGVAGDVKVLKCLNILLTLYF
jgi:hypothetical protein